MLHGRIEFTGRTLEDVRHAVEEALDRMTDAPGEGSDENTSGTFTYVLEEAPANAPTVSTEAEDLQAGVASLRDYERRKQAGTLQPGVPHEEVRRRLGLG